MNRLRRPAAPRRAARVWTAAAAAALAAGLMAGCGVTPEDEPRPIQPPRGPFAALNSPTPAVTASGPLTEQIVLVRDGTLVSVVRHVDRQPTTAGLVKDLLAGPTPAERAEDISSALTEDAVTGVSVRNGLAVVELSPSASGSARTDDVLAYAQLVCTLVSQPDIGAVSFTMSGQQVDVPRADGSLPDGPLTAADYASLFVAPSPLAAPSTSVRPPSPAPTSPGARR